MIGPTQEKNHSSAPSLARASHNQVTWRGIRWSTQERSHSAQSSKLLIARRDMRWPIQAPQVQIVLPELLKMIILLTCSDIFTGKFMKFSISLKFFFTGKYMKFSKSSKFLESKNNTGTFKKISHKSHWYLFSGSMFIQYWRVGCFKRFIKKNPQGREAIQVHQMCTWMSSHVRRTGYSACIL